MVCIFNFLCLIRLLIVWIIKLSVLVIWLQNIFSINLIIIIDWIVSKWVLMIEVCIRQGWLILVFIFFLVCILSIFVWNIGFRGFLSRVKSQIIQNILVWGCVFLKLWLRSRQLLNKLQFILKLILLKVIKLEYLVRRLELLVLSDHLGPVCWYFLLRRKVLLYSLLLGLKLLLIR